MQTIKNSLIMALAGTVLTACGGSGDSSDTLQPEPPESTLPTTLSVNVSDAPVDDALAVVVEFDSVELVGTGNPIVIDVRDEQDNPKQVDLLQFQGADFDSLLEDVEVPAGTYEQFRLNVTENSYIELEQGTFALRVPSGQLKLDGFTLAEEQQATFTVEFDLRKALVDPPGRAEVQLKPRGVRLVQNDLTGAIEGSVAQSLVLAEVCLDKTDVNKGNAVYIYQGHTHELSNLGDDTDEAADESEVSPYTIGEVDFDDEQGYRFEVAYLPAGEYTVGFTCLALNDVPESDEGAEQGFEIQAKLEVVLSAEQTVTVDFE
ncbi:DUF4382 domain-containing protein [Aestuariibacter salexigens]|uniref:DUF4382 domain-containing protein n=1 Tax=Aestuariibacter salexigens TaxID=226010 RepID=UPI000416C67F|nr:DUF4382 domain-containing protein [Aestuariibacter salexigens]